MQSSSAARYFQTMRAIANYKPLQIGLAFFVLTLVVVLGGCKKVEVDAAAQAPPNPNVVPFPDAALFSVDHPEQFPVTAAVQHSTASELVVTGTVMPDVSRNVPVVSLASGRVMAIQTRLGDAVDDALEILGERPAERALDGGDREMRGDDGSHAPSLLA